MSRPVRVGVLGGGSWGSTVASLAAALLLFVLPVNWRERRFTLTWHEAVRIDWGTVLLFGGGRKLNHNIFGFHPRGRL